MLFTSLLKRIRVLTLSVTFVSILLVSHVSYAAYLVIDPEEDSSCAKVLVLFARGSGQNSDSIYKLTDSPSEDPLFIDELNEIYREANVNGTEKQTAKFFEEFHKRVPKGVKYVSLHNETSSTGQKYNQYGYVAASAFDAIATPNNNYLRPSLHRKDTANRYYESVKDGAEELSWYLEDQMTSCPLQQVVLGGYSQGAEVVADGINILQPDFRSRIAFTALYGDPKYNSVASFIPYKIGNWVRGNTVNSITHGVLDARVPYVPDQLINMASWCGAGDAICDAGTLNTNDIYRIVNKNVKFNNDTHSNIYQGDTQHPGWIPKSMPEIVKAVKGRVSNLDVTSSVYINKGDKLWNLDLVIVMDSSSSMVDAIKTVKGSATSLSTSLLKSYWNSRVGIVTYGGLPGGRDDPSYEYSKVVTSFTNDEDTVRSGFQGITTESPFYNLLPDGTPYIVPVQSAQYAGIMTAIQDLQWEHGAQKKIIVITNNAATKPDPSPKHWTADQVRQAAFNLDPAGLNLFNTSCGDANGCDYSVEESFGSLATDSGGQIAYIDLGGPNSSGTGIDDLNNMIEKVLTQPVASISGDQTSYVGQPLYLNGDESYDPNGAVTEYDWDCTSDGTWDAAWSWPTHSCIYDQPGDYLVTMRAWASDDQQGTLAVLPVHILAGNPPVQPAAPEQPIASVDYTKDATRLTWSNPYGTDVYIKVADEQDNLIGYAPASAKSVTLSGIGSEVPELHVSACVDEGGCSEPAIVALNHEKLEAMTTAENTNVFSVDEASTTLAQTTDAAAQTDTKTVAINTNTPTASLVSVTKQIIEPAIVTDLFTPVASVLGVETAPNNAAEQLSKHGIAATSTTPEQDKEIPLKWRLAIGIPAIILGIAMLARYFWVRNKSK